MTGEGYNIDNAMILFNITFKIWNHGKLNQGVNSKTFK